MTSSQSSPPGPKPMPLIARLASLGTWLRCCCAPDSLAGARSFGHPTGDQPAFAGVFGKQILQLFAAAVQPGHHGADRRAHDLGDLLVGEALDIGEVNRE